MKVPLFVTLSMCWVSACAAASEAGATFGVPTVAFGASGSAVTFETEGSFALVGGAGGGQVALARPLKTLAMALAAGEFSSASGESEEDRGRAGLPVADAVDAARVEGVAGAECLAGTRWAGRRSPPE